MTKLSCIVFAAALATGCKSKDKDHSPPPTTGSGSATSEKPTGPVSTAWLDTLPTVAGGDKQVLLQFTGGLVRVFADGKLQVATPPTAAPADPRAPGIDPFASAKAAQAAGLATALGLPPVTPRTDSALGVTEGSGSDASANPTDVAFARLGHPAQAWGAPAPATRLTNAFALTHDNDVSGGIVVFADASAPAATLVDVLAQTGGFLAVRHDKALGALPLTVDRRPPAPVAPDRTWTELRLGASGALELATVPGAPQAVTADKLTEALTTAGAKAVDILVGPTTTTQELVTAIAAVQAAKIDAIGLGRAPAADSTETTARAAKGPRVLAWDYYIADVPDGTAITKALESALEPARACYEKALAKTKDLTGSGQFEIVLAEGKTSPVTTGLPPALATCAVTAFGALTVPATAKIQGKITFVR